MCTIYVCCGVDGSAATLLNVAISYEIATFVCVFFLPFDPGARRARSCLSQIYENGNIRNLLNLLIFHMNLAIHILTHSLNLYLFIWRMIWSSGIGLKSSGNFVWCVDLKCVFLICFGHYQSTSLIFRRLSDKRKPTATGPAWIEWMAKPNTTSISTDSPHEIRLKWKTFQ